VLGSSDVDVIVLGNLPEVHFPSHASPPPPLF
jgi:hypothetical protein